MSRTPSGPGSQVPAPRPPSRTTWSARRGLSASVGFLVAALCASGCTGASPASTAATPTSTATTPTSAGSASRSPGDRTDWEPVRRDSTGLLTPGRLGMTANGRPGAPWAVIDVPERFSSIDGWVIFDEDPRGGGGVGYWTISEVFPDPCGDSAPVAVGPRVEDVVAGLRRQQRTRISEPIPVEVDGHRGLSLELRVPEGIDFTSCRGYDLWESDPGGGRYMSAAGEFDRLWVLDVEGEVVVLTVTANTDVPEAALQRLTAMVESAQFVPRSAG